MKRLTALIAAAAAVLLIAGCGSYDEANNHNQPVQRADLRLNWQRVDSPPNYPTIVWACHGADGIYIDQDSGTTPFVVPNDPEC